MAVGIIALVAVLIGVGSNSGDTETTPQRAARASNHPAETMVGSQIASA